MTSTPATTEPLVSDANVDMMSWRCLADYVAEQISVQTACIRQLFKLRDRYETERVIMRQLIHDLEEQNRELSRMVSLEFEQAIKKGKGHD